MKKILLITLAVVLILVGGIWLYLFIFGAPESSQELFADLGFGSSPAPTEFTNDFIREDFPIEEVETGIDSNNSLNLLTLRPVAGATIVGTSTDKQVVRYVERGTGQIYEIDLANNNETLLSDAAIAQATQATWSNNGNLVVIESGNSTNPQVQLLTWHENTASGTNTQGQFIATDIAPDAFGFAFSEDNKNLFYLRTDGDGSLGYSYPVATNKPTVTFTLPFISPAVEWGSRPLIYNRPGEQQTGYAYRLVGGELESAGKGGEALVAKAFYNDGAILSTVHDGLLKGTYYSDSDTFEVALAALPEKCASGSNESYQMFCAYPFEQSGDLPTNWYKGTVNLQDYLWSIDIDPTSPNRGVASLVSDFTSEAGVTIDVIDMSTDYTKTRLLFTDKHTNALWMYDTALRNTANTIPN